MHFRELLAFVEEMTLRTGYPVPAPPGFASEWSRGLGIEGAGTGRLLFTGALYQLAPYIARLADFLRGVEGARSSAAVIRAARIAAGVVDLSRLPVMSPDPELLEWSRRVLRSVAGLLRSSGVAFDYVPEVSDMYSGALLRELGLRRAFEAHARRVLEAIRSAGAREVVTVDPHTHAALLDAAAALGADLRVVSYLQLVSPAGRAAAGRALAVHDSCIYARALGLSGRVRELLAAAGARVVEPPRSGRWTYCCGGPVESLMPSLSLSVARTRAAELESVAREAVTMCPICYVNLRRASRSLGLLDVAEVLGGGG